MSKPLAHFKKGVTVKIACYKKGCQGFPLRVCLGEEEEIHPSFIQGGGVGRFTWGENAVAKSFSLGETLGGSGYCNCPNCQTLFGAVIVVSRGQGKAATVFGYDPEPA